MIQPSHFQKLYIRASCICRCPNLFVIRYLPKGPAPRIGIGYLPIGVVKEIENLQPELHPLRFRDWIVFEDPDIMPNRKAIAYPGLNAGASAHHGVKRLRRFGFTGFADPVDFLLNGQFVEAGKGKEQKQ